MKKSIVDRVLKESEYILRTKETVREMAQVFKVSRHSKRCSKKIWNK